jgi:mono/diheme cytochrome c family protein
LTYWRWLFGPAARETSAAATDLLYARGAYLVEGLGHCGSCHTPRGFGLQEKALTAADGTAYLSGGIVDHYDASSLRGDVLTGLGRFSEDDIVRLLQTGRNSDTAVFGAMADVVTHSTQFMREGDLRAIAHYLKSLPGFAGGANFFYDTAVASELASGKVSARGARDYLNNCISCHSASGKGYAQTFPSLAGNPVVNGDDPSSLINIVLNGATVPPTNREPTHLTMPPFRDRLTDEQVSDVVTFIRSNWGNRASAVNAARVAGLRQVTRGPAPMQAP